LPLPPPHPVLLTGLGLVTPLGGDRDSSWRRLLAGEVAVRPLIADGLGQLVEGSAAGRDPAGWVGAPAVGVAEPRSAEPVVGLALRAAREALADAGLAGDATLDRERCGCVVGTSKGGLVSVRRALHGDVDAWATVPPAAAAQAVAREARFGGPLLCPVLACATGLAALVRGAELVRDGTCDLVLAGSSDASLLDVVVGSFRRLGVHASGGRAARCRPFDARRDGFVVGEGAAIVVLESADHAQRRGAEACAEWLGGRTYGDATGLMQLDPEGSALVRAIDDTLRAAGRDREEVTAAFLHGTGTPTNDLVETRALHRAFGDHARRIVGCGVKGSIGHLLGAAGSVETALAVQALRDGVVPPTTGLDERDPACDLDLAPVARPFDAGLVLKTSLGFGGHVAVGLLGPAPSR
jgi:3-oxoacyl-[acyl-carrier-protein] synthase II